MTPKTNTWIRSSLMLSSNDIEDMKNIYIVDAQSICQLGIDI